MVLAMKINFLKLLVVLVCISQSIGTVSCKSFQLDNIDLVNLELKLTPSSTGSRKGLKKFDGTRFKDNPIWLGEKVTIVYEKQVLGSRYNYGKPPNKKEVKRRLSRYLGEARVVLDVESWRIRTKQRLDPLAKDHAQWYANVLMWAHEALPGTNIGFFGLPSSPYFPVKSPSIFMSDYQQELTYLKPVLEASDSIYPSFYIYYDQPELLTSVWDEQLYQAKTYGKPVYPFLWHRGPGSILKNKILPEYLIRHLCRFVRNNADGFVWWSISWEKWDEGGWYNYASDCFH